MAVQMEVSVVRSGAGCGQAAVFVDDSYIKLAELQVGTHLRAMYSWTAKKRDLDGVW